MLIVCTPVRGMGELGINLPVQLGDNITIVYANN